MALTETVLVYFYCGLWKSFCSLRYFQEIILFKRSGILQDMYFSVLFIALRKETPTKDLAPQKHPFPDVYKKDLLIIKNFLKPPEKHLYRSF